MKSTGNPMSDAISKVQTCLAEFAQTSLMCGDGCPDSMIEYYQKKASQKRCFFRAVSILSIALGASLPAVAAFGKGLLINKDLALSVMSAGIAFLTALGSHFRWEIGWRSQTEALFALRAERAAWDAAVVQAKIHPNDDQAATFLTQAFEHFRVRTFDIAREERGKFFRGAQQSGVKASSIGAGAL
jgi:hypothetical protein